MTRLLGAITYFLLFLFVASQDEVENKEKIVNSLLKNFYNTGDKAWKSSVEACFKDNNFYNQTGIVLKDSLEQLSADTVNQLKKFTRACERVARFYKNLKSAMNKNFRGKQQLAEAYLVIVRNERIFEKNCRENCNYEAFLNSQVAEYAKKLAEGFEETVNASTVPPIISINIFDNETIKNATNSTIAKPEKLTVYVPRYDPPASLNVLRQNLIEWYPNRNDFQQYLLNISSSMNLDKTPGFDDIAWSKDNFEVQMEKILASPTFQGDIQKRIEEYVLTKLSPYPLVGRSVLFLDEENLDRNLLAITEMTKQEIFSKFQWTLEMNLKNWYPTSSDFFKYIVSKFNLLWSLAKSGADSALTEETFKQSVIKILNNRTRKADRESALKLRIKDILMDQYADFELYHGYVIERMEGDINNTYKADMLFDKKTLEVHIQLAVQQTKLENNYYSGLWTNIQSWYPFNMIFNDKLYGIVKENDIYLKSEASLDKAVFEDFVLSFLETSAYASDVRTEIAERFESLLSEQHPDMENFEYEAFKMFSQAIGSQSKAKLLFNKKEFKEKAVTAMVEMKNKIIADFFVKFKTELNAWLPNSESFVNSYLLFLRNSNLSLNEIRQFDRLDDYVLAENSTQFRIFAKTHRQLITTTTKYQVQQVLVEFDPARVDRNLEIVGLVDSSLVDELTSVQDLKHRIVGILKPIQKCLKKFNETVDEFMSENPNGHLELFQHLKRDVCISDEVCVKAYVTDSRPRDELKAYLDDFFETKAGFQSQMIDDKVINAVVVKIFYVSIEKLLSERKNVRQEDVRCFVNYLRRINVMRSIYSDDLLFNDAELAEKIKTFEEEYKQLYKRILK